MSKTFTSIYEHFGKTLVAFGSGAIQIGVASDEFNQIQVHLIDTMKSHEIGLQASWEETKGRTVILGFNKIESIIVLQEQLQKAKELLEIRQNIKDKK